MEDKNLSYKINVMAADDLACSVTSALVTMLLS